MVPTNEPLLKSASQHSVGTSIALLAVVVAVIGWVVLPTVVTLSIGFLAASWGLIYLCEKGAWAISWSEKKKHVWAFACVAVLSAVVIPQLWTQRKKQRPPSSEVCHTILNMKGGSVSNNNIGIANLPPGVCVNLDGTILDHNGVAIQLTPK